MNPVIIIFLAAGLSLLMAFAWVVQRLTRNSGWVDVIWSSAIGLVGVTGALIAAPDANSARQIAVATLVGLWSARLTWHIGTRAIRGEDDPRYADMAKKAGKSWPLQLFVFLQIQAAAGLVLVLAVRLAAVRPDPFPGLSDVFGAVLLLIAVAGEAVSDAQLARFTRTHKGERAVCDIGLWYYSRHPNYFFEWLGWCAFAVIAIDPAGSHPWGYAALAAPALMYGLLVYVSGIPPLEQHMLRSRGEAFRAYQARTSPFFPAPPRKS